jgi:hypothetical protein
MRIRKQIEGNGHILLISAFIFQGLRKIMHFFHTGYHGCSAMTE